MAIKEKIEADLKQAMLAGNKDLVTTLRTLKSSILYAEVAENKRDEGLSDQAVTALLQKEAKKRQESAELFHQGGNEVKAKAEEEEKQIIEQYLPKQLTEEEIQTLIDQEAAKMGDLSMQQMGQLIGAVKQASQGAADGGVIARLVKEKLS